MKKRVLAFIAALGVVFAAAQAQGSNACTMPNDVQAMATQIAVGVNENRRANGQHALRYNPQLSQAAMRHACDMSLNNFFDHRGSDGSDVMRRVQATGYRSCLAAENLAWGYPKPNQIINGWMMSAGHRSNMMHPRASEFGLGITNGPRGPNWVLIVARGC